MQSSHAIPINQRLITFLAVIGALFGLWLAVLENGRINGDADLYLEMARRFAQGDSQGALALYNWPLLPLLMALVHQVTGLGVEYAGRMLGAVFFGIATWGFLTLVRMAGGGRNDILAGALLLFCSPYIAADILPMIMRDQGFWAFYLLGLVFFLRFYRDGRLIDALSWQFCALLATLFRVEAVSFLLLLPLVLLARQDHAWRTRLRDLGASCLLPLCGVMLVVAVAMLLPATEWQNKLGRLTEMHSALLAAYQQVSGGLAAKADIYGKQVLGHYLNNYAMPGLCLTLLLVVASKIAGASGWLAVTLAAFGGRFRTVVMQPDVQRVLLWAAAINLLNLAVILLTTNLLSARYVVGMAFIVLVFAAFNLAGLYDNWRAGRSRRLAAVLLLAVLIMGYHLITSLAPHDKSYNYEQAAVAWTKQHAARDARIYYDGARLRYYAQAPWGGRADRWQNNLDVLRASPARFDYLLLRVQPKYPEQRALLGQLTEYRVLREFKRKNGDIIVVLAAHNMPD